MLDDLLMIFIYDLGIRKEMVDSDDDEGFDGYSIQAVFKIGLVAEGKKILLIIISLKGAESANERCCRISLQSIEGLPTRLNRNKTCLCNLYLCIHSYTVHISLYSFGATKKTDYTRIFTLSKLTK